MKKLFFVVLIGLFLTGCGNKQETNGGMNMKEGHDMAAMSNTGNEPGMAKEQGMKKGQMMTADKSKSAPVFRKANKDEIGKQVVCPVMGNKFNVKENTEVADYKGKSYYFCCGACPPQFKENPDKYAK